MDLQEVQRVLEASDLFRAFKSQKPDAYLVHLFSMHGPGAPPTPQLGYYSPITGGITSFRLDPLAQEPEDEPFNKGDSPLPLDLSTVTVTPGDAEEKALLYQREHVPAEAVTKVILLLQHLEQQLYNLTLVTSTFNILNVRIDASSGVLLKSEFRSIMSLRRD